MAAFDVERLRKVRPIGGASETRGIKRGRGRRRTILRAMVRRAAPVQSRGSYKYAYSYGYGYGYGYVSSGDDDRYSGSDDNDRYSGGSNDSGLPPHKRIHFVAAASSGFADLYSMEPSSFVGAVRCRHREMEPKSSPTAAAGILAYSPAVANMMARMNYEAGFGLGKYGHGIVDPIAVAKRPKYAGLGTVEAYDRPTPPPLDPKVAIWSDSGSSEWLPSRADRTCAKVSINREQLLARLRGQKEAYAAERKKKIRRVSRCRKARAARDKGGEGEETDHAEKTISRAMTVIHKESVLGRLRLGGLIYEFTGLKDKFPEEYTAHRLADTAGPLAAPLLRPLLQGWEVTQAPECALDVLKMLKKILDVGTSSSCAAMSPPYVALVEDVVVPAVQASSWSATDPDQPMLRFLETWKDMLPPSAVWSILEKVVVPKLAAAAEKLDLRWDSVPAHVWMSPWVPHLGRLPRCVFDAMERSLVKGDGIEATYHDMVTPLRDVFDPATWDEFAAREIVPIMRGLLQEIDGASLLWQTGAGKFAEAMKWAAAVPARHAVELLEEEFFGKWEGALFRLLMGVRPLPRQATAWYNAWKGLFAPELLAEERVVGRLEAGLGMIAQAAQGQKLIRPGGK